MEATITLPTENQSLGNYYTYPLQPWIVCFSAALFFFYEFFQMNMFNSISADLMTTFHITGTQLGNLSATYLYADVLFLLPAGIILDRFSVRKVILTALSICVISTILFSQATSFWFAAVCHFFSGLGNSFCFLSCMMLASRWFPPKRLALVTGLIVTLAMLGGMVAQTPLTLLSETIGWRNALLTNGGIGIIILFLNWAFIKEWPNEALKPIANDQKLAFWHNLFLALKNIHSWLYGVYTCLLNLPIMVLGALWGSMALMAIHHFSARQASVISAMIFLGTIVGGPLVGSLSDKMGSRKSPMYIFGFCSLLIMTSIIMIQSLGFWDLIVLYFLLGFFTSAQIVSYPAITENNSRELTGTAMGIASVIIMGGGAIAQPLFGLLLDWRWNGIMVNGKPYFTGYDFHFAMWMIPIGFVLGLCALFFARETHCQNLKKDY